MFFTNNKAGGDSPTIEPLRIQKRDGMSPEPRTGSASNQRRGYAVPPSFSPPPAASGAGGGPLPYPDEGPQRTNSTRLPYPDEGWPAAAQQPSPPGSRGSSPSANIPQYPRPPAERRGTGTKPLPDSPGPETPDKEGLFQKAPKRAGNTASGTSGPQPTYQAYHKQYFPPPGSESESASGPTLQAPKPVNRFGSTASNATTKAQRGSPPPPETPILPPDDHLGGIEARYAASGISGTQTLTGLQAQSAQSAAAAQRANQYGSPPGGQTTSPPQQSALQRPWTPTELPGSNLHGHNVVYQGSTQQPSPPRQQQSNQPSQPTAGRYPGQDNSAIAEDIQRLHVSGSPPPAYSSVSRPSGQTTAQGYPSEKAGGASGVPGAAPATAAAAGVAAGAAAATSLDQHHTHPAYANDPQHEASQAANSTHQAAQQPEPSSQPGPASPPPLPEGWIAHLDQNSGHYYYIHLPTQSTQWEFPKGPTPLNLHEPTSPVGGHFGGGLQSPGISSFSKPLQSPGFAPATPGYAESVMSMQSQAPTVTGFTGPPPSSGVDIYKIAPTNGVYFGPYLRYINMDQEKGLWLGSILLVTDAPQPPTIHIHQTVDLSPNPRQLKANPISRHQRWTFYRYDIELQMEDHESKWTYAITSHLGCTRYEFVVAARRDVSWRFIATSGNDFALNVSANERQRLGGLGLMWKDIMMRHQECGGFHAQLGMGDQIYADRIWREIPSLKQWLVISGKENRKNEPWTPRHEEDVTHAYFHYYTSHFDQPFLREAFAQIPYILQIDDHDM
jgi:PhoD related phosphatase/WW domain